MLLMVAVFPTKYKKQPRFFIRLFSIVLERYCTVVFPLWPDCS